MVHDNMAYLVTLICITIPLINHEHLTIDYIYSVPEVYIIYDLTKHGMQNCDATEGCDTFGNLVRLPRKLGNNRNQK